MGWDVREPKSMLASATVHSSHRPRRPWLSLAALVVGGLHLIPPLLSGLLGIGLILTVLLERSPRRITRILLAVALLTILATPWLYRYQPAVVAAQVMRCAGLLNPICWAAWSSGIKPSGR